MARKNWQPEKILAKHVLGAAKKWDSDDGYLNFQNSRKYDVIIKDNPYPPKAICACAHELATGTALSSEEFAGAKDGLWHKRLKDLGFPIVEKSPEIDFYTEVITARKLKPERRVAQLAELEHVQPERILVQIYRYKRSPLVVAERLSRANGICQKCNESAPFARKRDGTPFLEVHHVRPLSKGGFDTVANTIALCPNCHCETHDQMDLDTLSD